MLISLLSVFSAICRAISAAVLKAKHSAVKMEAFDERLLDIAILSWGRWGFTAANHTDNISGFSLPSVNMLMA